MVSSRSALQAWDGLNTQPEPGLGGSRWSGRVPERSQGVPGGSQEGLLGPLRVPGGLQEVSQGLSGSQEGLQEVSQGLSGSRKGPRGSPRVSQGPRRVPGEFPGGFQEVLGCQEARGEPEAIRWPSRLLAAGRRTAEDEAGGLKRLLGE